MLDDEREAMPATRPQFLLIGTGHWSNPGLDIVSSTFDDMLAPARQAEIADVVKRLACFQPTKVAIEVTPAAAPEWIAEYDAFRRGAFQLTANERHQLGFRIADAAGLDQVHGVDWHDHDRPIPWEQAFAFARQHDQDHLLGFYHEEMNRTEEDREVDARRIATMSVKEQLLGSDDLEGQAVGHKVYMDIAQIGTTDNFIGAQVALRWYERNMMIFANLARLAGHPDDRILLVIGGGHLPILRHLIIGAGRFDIEKVGTYLDG
jgi:hypothetical protein